MQHNLQLKLLAVTPLDIFMIVLDETCPINLISAAAKYCKNTRSRIEVGCNGCCIKIILTFSYFRASGPITVHDDSL